MLRAFHPADRDVTMLRALGVLFIVCSCFFLGLLGVGAGWLVLKSGLVPEITISQQPSTPPASPGISPGTVNELPRDNDHANGHADSPAALQPTGVERPRGRLSMGRDVPVRPASLSRTVPLAGSVPAFQLAEEFVGLRISSVHNNGRLIAWNPASLSRAGDVAVFPSNSSDIVVDIEYEDSEKTLTSVDNLRLAVANVRKGEVTADQSLILLPDAVKSTGNGTEPDHYTDWIQQIDNGPALRIVYDGTKLGSGLRRNLGLQSGLTREPTSEMPVIIAKDTDAIQFTGLYNGRSQPTNAAISFDPSREPTLSIYGTFLKATYSMALDAGTERFYLMPVKSDSSAVRVRPEVNRLTEAGGYSVTFSTADHLNQLRAPERARIFFVAARDNEVQISPILDVSRVDPTDRPAISSFAFTDSHEEVDGVRYVKHEDLEFAANLDLAGTSDVDFVVRSDESSQLLFATRLNEDANNVAGSTKIRFPQAGPQSVYAALVQGTTEIHRSDSIHVNVLSGGPRVHSVDPAEFSFGDKNSIRIQFATSHRLDPAAALESINYVLMPAGAVSGDDAVTQTRSPQFDAAGNSVVLHFNRNIGPGTYTLTVKSEHTVEGGGTKGIQDLAGNFLVKAAGNAVGYSTTISKSVDATLPTTQRGITAATGPYVKFPEYTEPRENPGGFNPSDKVITRIARLYYFRDAHRVTQIVNRKAKSYNRQGVDRRQMAADSSLRAADIAADRRLQLERKAVRAAQEARAAENALEQHQQALIEARRELNRLESDLDRMNDMIADLEARPVEGEVRAEEKRRLQARQERAVRDRDDAQERVDSANGRVRQAPEGEPLDSARANLQAALTQLERAERELRRVNEDLDELADVAVATQLRRLRQTRDRLVRQRSDAETQVTLAESRVRAMLAQIQAKRTEEVQSTELWEDAERNELRAREEQFRREVAAATEDPDTYAPAEPESQDPVEQVSISVVGEGLIQLRGPRKGVNIVHTMINQLDAPVGQVSVAIHTVQINGEHGDRMEKVAMRIERYLDHARFLTMQSAQMLRNAVVTVASRKAQQIAATLPPDCAQDVRVRKYREAFFGSEFIQELRQLDSEFLMSGNKLLSLHSMDTTSLSSALFLLALAKNDTRLEILQEFMAQVQTKLPHDEIEYFQASGAEFKFCGKEFQFLGHNARFVSLRGFFDAQVYGSNTLNPMQREFIRLAQIFKSRLVTEIELRQRVMERALIEERIGNYQEQLRAAKRDEDIARHELEAVEKKVLDSRQEFANAVRPLKQRVAQIKSQSDDMSSTLHARKQELFQSLGNLIQQILEVRIRSARVDAASDEDRISEETERELRRILSEYLAPPDKRDRILKTAWPLKPHNLEQSTGACSGSGCDSSSANNETNGDTAPSTPSPDRISTGVCTERICRFGRAVININNQFAETLRSHQSEEIRAAADLIKLKLDNPKKIIEGYLEEIIDVEFDFVGKKYYLSYIIDENDKTNNRWSLSKDRRISKDSAAPESAWMDLAEDLRSLKEHAEKIVGRLRKDFNLSPANEGRLKRATRMLEYMDAKLATDNDGDSLRDSVRVLEAYKELAAVYQEVQANAQVVLAKLHQIETLSRRRHATWDDFERVEELWTNFKIEVQSRIENEGGYGDEARKMFNAVDRALNGLGEQYGRLEAAQRNADRLRRPLNHKKFLDMLVDDVEEKFIDLVEGTRAHTANIDNYLQRLTTALDDDLNTQFYYPTFRYVRETSYYYDVQVAQIETTSVVANNRMFANVSPQATMEFDLPKRDILINEAFNGALAAYNDYGALLGDPTFLSLMKLYGGQPTSATYGSGMPAPMVRDVLPGLPSQTDERFLSQANNNVPRVGSNLEALIPDPAIYKFETGTGYEIRPVIQPDGQAVVFHFDYLYSTNVREPVRADEKHLGRIRRHFIDTDIVSGNFELKKVSRYQVALKASRTERGVPLLEDMPGVGVLFRPLPQDESSLQQNLVLSQTTIFPTLFDLMGLRWAPAVADLDSLTLQEREFVTRNREKLLRNEVFDYSSLQVDEFMRVPDDERRGDLYRTQESIPYSHPNGYQGRGLNLRNGHLREGYAPRNYHPEPQYVPERSDEHESMHTAPLIESSGGAFGSGIPLSEGAIPAFEGAMPYQGPSIHHPYSGGQIVPVPGVEVEPGDCPPSPAQPVTPYSAPGIPTSAAQHGPMTPQGSATGGQPTQSTWSNSGRPTQRRSSSASTTKVRSGIERIVERLKPEKKTVMKPRSARRSVGAARIRPISDEGSERDKRFRFLPQIFRRGAKNEGVPD